jgi:transcriptional regulator with XRE-family HTH domain
MTLREIFARNLRRLRHERKLSQEELAFRARISRGYMSDLERATYSASLDMVEAIAKVLAVDPAHLLEKAPGRTKR